MTSIRKSLNLWLVYEQLTQSLFPNARKNVLQHFCGVLEVLVN